MRQSTTSRAAIMPKITCNGCDAAWTATGAAHCGSCHHTFSTAGLFDAHRHAGGSHGGCLHPAEIMRSGERMMFYRDGMWRGPEMPEDEKLRRRSGQQ